MKTVLRNFTFLFAFLFIVACESSEQKAEKHYQNGIALLEAGDVQRALVEFRNVFMLDGNHRDARATYARTVYEQGNFTESFKQYLRLVEQYPNDIEGRIALSRMAFDIQRWDEFERHAEKLRELGATDPEAQVVTIAMDYRTATLAKDTQARNEQARLAKELSTTLDNDVMLQSVLVDNSIQNGDLNEALVIIDAVLAKQPDQRRFYDLKLRILAKTGDEDGVEDLLTGMVDRFPDDENIRQTLLRYYTSQGRMNDAEAFMRKLYSPSDDDLTSYLSYIRFILINRGPEAALEELSTALNSNPSDEVKLRILQASIQFEQGQQDQAIADLEAVLETATASDSQRDAKVTLAKMLQRTKNEVGARRLVEEVLAEDATHVEATKMQAGWLIEGDNIDGAINALRTALNDTPNDPQLLSLMANAYMRSGSPELAREYFARAVEASRNAPNESNRYAQLLMQEEKYASAEDTLLAALRVSPKNLDILTTLGRLYLIQEDYPRAQQVIDRIQAENAPQAMAIANSLKAELLNKTEGADKAVAFLQELANSDGDTNTRAAIGVILAQLRTGRAQDALSYAENAVSNDPENLGLRVGLAAAQMANRMWPEAEAQYRQLLEKQPNVASFWLELSRALSAQGEFAAAEKAIDTGLETIPQSGELLWAKASLHEQKGDIEAAIAIYEDLYERSSGSAVVANNLASLLSVWRDDAESLNRAYTIARRFRSAELPAFQDTYGWIAYKRGEYEEALNYLEPAAEGLPNDAMAQYHLAKTYQALGRMDDALEAYLRVINVAGDVDTRPQIKDARDQMRAIQAQD